jgi:hypothetical protein
VRIVSTKPTAIKRRSSTPTSEFLANIVFNLQGGSSQKTQTAHTSIQSVERLKKIFLAISAKADHASNVMTRKGLNFSAVIKSVVLRLVVDRNGRRIWYA